MATWYFIWSLILAPPGPLGGVIVPGSVHSIVIGGFGTYLDCEAFRHTLILHTMTIQGHATRVCEAQPIGDKK